MRHYSPLARPCRAAFVAAPAKVGTLVLKNRGVGLILTDKLKIRLKIVNLLSAARTFAAGTVQPDVENLAVICEQLRKLCAVEIVILIRTVAGSVSVPRGKVEAELYASPFTSLGKLTNNVALAVFVGAVFY